MSESADYHWSLEDRRRREAFLDRIQKNTENFLDKFRRKFNHLLNQGLETYLPDEFAELHNLLDQLGKLVSTDPERARDLSFQVGKMLSELHGLARIARKEYESREQERRKELAEMRRQTTTALNKYIHDLVSEIKDPVELDYAYDEIRTIQAEYQERIVEVSELDTIKNSIGSRFSEIRNLARIKAEAWKDKQVKSSTKEIGEELLSLYTEQTNDNLEGVKELIDNKADLKDIHDKIIIATKEADRAIVDENCRRLVVRSIMDSLVKLGFVVSKPKRCSSGGIDEVVILARKPAGAEANFWINTDGSMKYKFHHYEGKKCMDDINKVLPILKDIYGINLSDKRILWQNPERISKSAKPIDGNIERHKNV